MTDMIVRTLAVLLLALPQLTAAGDLLSAPEEARAVFAASPFGAPAEERMLLDGVFWVFRVRKAGR